MYTILKSDHTMYEFRGYFKSAPNRVQHKYVCACDEKSAIDKIESYIKEIQKKDGDEFVWIDKIKLEGVII